MADIQLCALLFLRVLENFLNLFEQPEQSLLVRYMTFLQEEYFFVFLVTTYSSKNIFLNKKLWHFDSIIVSKGTVLLLN